MTNYLFLGATSAIAEHTARSLIAPDSRFFLVARDANKLKRLASDLRVRGASYVDTAPYDFSDSKDAEDLINLAIKTLGPIDQALIAFGVLTNQSCVEKTPTSSLKDMTLNFAIPAIFSQLIANHMCERGKGLLAIITSVAGDRGRSSNYFYGSAKGGLGIFLQGLRHKLSSHGVAVLDIRPGFVDTPMTRDFKKGPLWAKPESVGRSIAQAMRKNMSGRFYVPRFWFIIMLLIRNLPPFLIHRTRL